ncbi:hypothetical protein AGMMS49942_10380 [Spirochaetia bacterium]|nr:hypothetical protein AGMMS49942_10380 [Spirochaetia bacterium]
MSLGNRIESFALGTLSTLIPKFNRSFLMKLTEANRLKPRKLLRLDVHLADHCNLNCRGCEHLSPLGEEKLLALDTFERDCARLSELSGGRIAELSLLGGEPLLHPRLTEFLPVARNYFPSGRIQVATNGILLLKQPPDFWEALHKNRIRLCVTVYPITINHDEIKRLGKKHRVEIVYWGSLKHMNKLWEKMPIDLSGAQDAGESFRKCYAANYCFQLVEGKIYPCFRAAYIGYFNRQFNTHLQVTADDYIDIYKAKTIQELVQFLCKPVPFCRYCNMKQVEYTEWGVSKKEISEWT